MYKTKDGTSLFIQKETIPHGNGGEAGIYQITSPQKYKQHVAKIFTKSNNLKKMEKKKRKIEYIVSHIQPILPNNKIKKSLVIAEDLILDKNNSVVGYIMPYIKDKIPLHHITLNEFDDLGEKWDILNYHSDKDTDLVFLNRLILSLNIVKAIKVLHNTKQIVLVDLKPHNILCSFDGSISIIDLDSIQIENQNIFIPADVTSPDYTTPEKWTLSSKYKFTKNGESIPFFHEIAIDASWDRFILGIILYQLIIDIHPFNGHYKEFHNINREL